MDLIFKYYKELYVSFLHFWTFCLKMAMEELVLHPSILFSIFTTDVYISRVFVKTHG